VVDIVAALIQQPDYQAARKYWKVLKGRLAKEGSELVTNCYQLKMAAGDGKQRLTDVRMSKPCCALFKASQSKGRTDQALAGEGGYERIQDMSDPARSLDRAREYWQQHGRSENGFSSG